MSLSDWHNKFGGRYWRVTSEGIETKDSGYLRSRGKPTTMMTLWEDFGEEIYYASKELNVPADMIAAMIPIEAVRDSEGHYDPKSLRLEPGYTSDANTPHRVSPGLMQTLISTAKSMARKYDLIEEDKVTRELLFEPHYSILLGGAYIAHQIDKYGPDPVLICSGYNAGSVRKTSRNPWHLIAYGATRIDRYVQWFNDFHAAARDGLVELPDDIVLSLTHMKDI